MLDGLTHPLSLALEIKSSTFKCHFWPETDKTTHGLSVLSASMEAQWLTHAEGELGGGTGSDLDPLFPLNPLSPRRCRVRAPSCFSQRP